MRPHRRQPTRLPCPWDSPGKNIGAIVRLQCCSTPVVVVQCLSHIWLFATPWIATCQASLFFAIFQSLLKLKFIKSIMPSNHLILCHHLYILSSIFPSIRVFSSELTLHIRWLNYWSFIFNISPSNEYSGLISFRIDWCDLLAVQGTLKSLLQYHIWKVSILPLNLLSGPTHIHTWPQENHSFD